MSTNDFNQKYPFRKEELQMLFEELPLNIFFKDTEGRYQLTSHLCDMLSGDDPSYTIRGKTDLEVQPDKALGRKFYEEDLKIVRSGEELHYMQDMQFGDKVYCYEISKRPVYRSDNTVMGILGTVTDRTALADAQRELEFQASTDPLTGVCSRYYLEQCLKALTPEDYPLSLVMIDCNRLKEINDLYGHQMGDKALCILAQNILDCKKENSVLVRYGGDEFLLLCPRTDGSGCVELINRVQASEIHCRIGEHRLSASYGYAVAQDETIPFENLLREADRRMYLHKTSLRAWTGTGLPPAPPVEVVTARDVRSAEAGTGDAGAAAAGNSTEPGTAAGSDPTEASGSFLTAARADVEGFTAFSSTLTALHAAFEKALSIPFSRESMQELLREIGERLGCDRIGVFERTGRSACENTYEWCKEGVLPKIDLLGGLSQEDQALWSTLLEKSGVYCVPDCTLLFSSFRRSHRKLASGAFRDDAVRKFSPGDFPDTQKGTDAGSGSRLSPVLMCSLSFCGEHFGYVLLENPSKKALWAKDALLFGIRNTLASMLYSGRMTDRLAHVGYLDTLTGTGNRLSLQSRLEGLDRSRSLGIIFCEAFSTTLNEEESRHMSADHLVLKASQVLRGMFDDSTIFRVGPSRFLVLLSGMPESAFRGIETTLLHLFQEHHLLVAMGTHWGEECCDNINDIIMDCRLRMYEDRRALSSKWRRDAAPLQIEFSTGSAPETADIHLYFSNEFFTKADQWLLQVYDEYILTLVIDINFFRMFNDIFGRNAGNLFLESVSETLRRKCRETGGIAGYLGGDNFCALLPCSTNEPAALTQKVEAFTRQLNHVDGFTPLLGLYISEDRRENAITLYDRALSALEEIKGSYTDVYRFYDADSFESQRNSKLLLMDVPHDIENGAFLFHLQPQVYEPTGQIVGAEAVVRWNRGGEMLLPDQFMDVLEKSGSIYAVDCHTWENVCIWLRSVLDRGLPPVRISVNVSRVDFYFTDIAQHFIDLTERYGIPHDLLALEITETALTDNNDMIRTVVDRLHEAGFTIMMDDFGSGSSSLSMLHQMHLDVLKTDVAFMSRDPSNWRAISIVESVISMAHLIGMMVITEGIETRDQRDSLMDLGDNYAQGDFFYPPMTPADFETLLQDASLFRDPPRYNDHLHFREMINDSLLSDLLLDNIAGPAAVFQESEGVLSIVQMNEQYSRLTGIAPTDTASMAHYLDHYDSRMTREVFDGLRRARSHPLEGSETSVEFKREDGRFVRILTRIFLLYSFDGHRLYLSTLQT